MLDAGAEEVEHEFDRRHAECAFDGQGVEEHLHFVVLGLAGDAAAATSLVL